MKFIKLETSDAGQAAFLKMSKYKYETQKEGRTIIFNFEIPESEIMNFDTYWQSVHSEFMRNYDDILKEIRIKIKNGEKN